MKKSFIVLFFLSITVVSFSQGTLQFSRAILVGSSTPQTVPANTVWKVVSLYGLDFTTGSCVALNSYYYDKITQAGMSINGNLVGVQYGVGSGCIIHYNSCSGSAVNGGQACSSSGWVDAVTNAPGNTTLQNINATLPLWLPASSTLQTLGSTTFASVIEFNIIP